MAEFSSPLKHKRIFEQSSQPFAIFSSKDFFPAVLSWKTVLWAIFWRMSEGSSERSQKYLTNASRQEGLISGEILFLNSLNNRKAIG